MKADTDSYYKMMREIKYRIEVVTMLINKDIDMKYMEAQVESIALQMRMIIESIALASLSANKSLFEKESDKFKKFGMPKVYSRILRRETYIFFQNLLRFAILKKQWILSLMQPF